MGKLLFFIFFEKFCTILVPKYENIKKNNDLIWWSERFPGDKRFRSIQVLYQELLPGPRSWIFVFLSFLVPIFAKNVRFSWIFTKDSWPPGILHYLPAESAESAETRSGCAESTQVSPAPGSRMTVVCHKLPQMTPCVRILSFCLFLLHASVILSSALPFFWFR